MQDPTGPRRSCDCRCPAVEDNFLENRPVFRTLFHIVCSAPGVILIGLCAHTLRVEDEVKPVMIQYMRAMKVENSANIHTVGLTAICRRLFVIALDLILGAMLNKEKCCVPNEAMDCCSAEPALNRPRLQPLFGRTPLLWLIRQRLTFAVPKPSLASRWT